MVGELRVGDFFERVCDVTVLVLEIAECLVCSQKCGTKSLISHNCLLVTAGGVKFRLQARSLLTN